MTTPLHERLRGKFIVFDGPDGAGKGTQIERLQRLLDARGIPVTRGKDPGGTGIGDRIRHILLHFDLSEMDVQCETLLFMASRAQLVGQVVRPALNSGRTVLCDRYVSATCAYQGAAGNDPARVIELARFAIGDTWPDATLILDLPPKDGFERTGRPLVATRPRRHAADQHLMFADAEPDAMEMRPMAFHERVRAIFKKLPSLYPKPVAIVDASGDPDDVHSRVLSALDAVFA